MSPEEKAYILGKARAYQDFEKTAFLSTAFNAGKFLLGMGHLGAKGSNLARLSAHHVGMPLGFGVMGALGAEEGEKGRGFLKGLAGGLAFNAAMPLGGWIGKRLLAPGFGGKYSKGLVRGMGFSDDAAARISASQGINRPLHGSMQRRLGAGTARTKDITKMRDAWNAQNQGLNLSGTLKAQQESIASLLKAGVLSPQQQAELAKQLGAFSKGLYQSGLQTGGMGSRAFLKGTRFAKGLGTLGGGMGLGMYASHGVEGSMDTTPASYFDARGGH